MSYNTINQCANDTVFQGRIQACIAQEGGSNPNDVMAQIMWPVVTNADIAAAYEYAINTGNENPGGDEAAITDAMILAAVQANMPSS